MNIFAKRCVFCEDYFKKQDCVWHSRFLCICRDCWQTINNRTVHNIIEVQPPLSRIIPCLYYTDVVRKAVHNLKFNDNPAYTSAFSFIVEERLNKIWELYQFDAIVTLPLSKQRMNERGFNQSAFIADTAEKVLGIPQHNEYLTRVKDTNRQSSLNHYERILNIRGAYSASSAAKDKNILLVDDIYTSGSTINEAAHTLRNAGAKTIMAIVFTSQPPRKRPDTRYIDI
ncbi:MAG: phosphoribosyltransferase family protein [bacterium]|nr:phosphoribosyltransferase family protein [bacterium]